MPLEPLKIAITGKGGVGKTSFTALLLKSLLHYSPKKILVVDADPAANLALVLGIPLTTTVGQMIDKTKREVEQKADFYDGGALLEYRLWDEALIEKPKFHFIAMGSTAGRGCYCPINNILTYMLENLQEYYDIVLLDMDAGLEYLSRNTKRHIRFALIITDASRMGFQTAQRIIELAKALNSPIDAFKLVGNMFPNQKTQEKLHSLANTLQIPLLGVLPFDKTLADMNLHGRNLLDLSEDSPAYQATFQFLPNLFTSLNSS